MKNKITSTAKSTFTVRAFLMTLLVLLSFSGWSQHRIQSAQGVKSNAVASALLQTNTPQVAVPANDGKEISPKDAFKGKREDTTKRDAFSKHFINNDGSFTALIGAGPIHYKKDGKFLDIDHTIQNTIDASYPYANTTNLFESYFGASAHEGIKNKTAEGVVKEFMNTKMYWEVNGQALNTTPSANMAITVQGDKAYYTNLYGNISAEFIIESGRRKLNYIIPNQGSLGNIPANADYLVFTEDVILPQGWKHTITKNGIAILDQNNKQIYLYESPSSKDASNQLSREKNTFYETSINGNILTIITKVKTAWLLDTQRQFPVKVDPTVNANQSFMVSVYDDGEEETGGYFFGRVGGYFLNTFVKYNTSSIASGSTISAATSLINISSKTGTSNAQNGILMANSADPTTTSGLSLYNSATTSLATTLNNTTTGNKTLTFTAGGRTYIEASLGSSVNLSIYGAGSWNNNNYYALGTANNYPRLSITYTAPAACSGTPTGGTTVLAPTTGTYGTTIAASVTGSTAGVSGLTYQWQSAPTSSGTWTNISGATLATAALTAPNALATTYYRRQITCSGNSSYSTAVAFTTTCSPSYINGNCAEPGDCQYIGISNVNMGTINNTTGFANAAPAYNNYSGTQSTNVSEGTAYTLSVTYKDNGAPVNLGKIGAWVDWNNDGDFEDANEFLGVTANVTNAQIVTFTVTVPAGTALGAKKLRVRSVYYDETLTSTDACTVKEYGETEDYALNVVVSNRTLTVAGAYTGASYANGANTIANNASVTATSGTRTGYTITGWTGTGSVPATGATGSTTFTITQNSTISWNWTCSVAAPTVTNGSGCADITLTADAAGATEYRWYDAVTGGTLAQTTTTGEWVISGLTQTTTYYVAAYNGTCESARVAVTATYTPTTAEITFTEGVAICEPGTVTVYADANGSNNVLWYDAATGGNLLFTGTVYTFTATDNVTFYVAAAEGTCESSRTEVTVTFNGKTWNGTLSNDWNSAGNWTPTGVPTADNCVVIGTSTVPPVILSGTNASAKSLTLLSGGSLVVKSGSSIDVVENVTVATDANMTLENEGYLVQTVSTSSNTNIGAITVKRNSTPMFRSEATGWASPVEDQKLYDFAIGTVFGRIYEYDETSNVFVNSSITLQSPFVLGKGYSVRSPDNYPTFSAVTPTTPLTFEGSFTGKPNNGDIGINLTLNNLGINYVGNPYPSPISATDLFDANSIADAFYFWTHEAPPINGVYAANNYATFNKGTGGVQAAAGGLTPNGTIEVGQGFVVRTSGAGTLQFTNAMRTNQSGGQFFRQADATADRHRMWLNLSNSENNFNQILIGYVPFATMEKDNQIDAKMIGYASSTLSSLIDNDTFVIQGRSLPFVDTDEVPLGFKAKQAGMFTIAIDHVDGLFSEGQTIYLMDALLGTTHDLSQSAYSFMSEQGTFNTRFKVVYQPEALSVNNPELNNNNWIVYKNENQINIKSNGFDIESVEIYDLTGRLLLNQQNVNSATFSCAANFAQQVLLVRVNKVLVKKVL